MDKIFIVYDTDASLREEDHYFFVKAKNEDDAWEKVVINKLINKDYIKNYIYSNTCNEGLSETFYRDSKGWLFNEIVGGFRDDLKNKFNDDNSLIINYINNNFKKNVIDFFKHNIEFANIYIDYAINDKIVDFPEDMLIYMIKKEFKKFYEIKPIEIL